MSNLVQSIVNDDFVWRAVMSKVSGQGRSDRNGYFNIKCPICHDYKPRCGIKHSGDLITASCFNCSFRAGWSIGNTFTSNFKRFLSAIGHGDTDIAALNYKAFQYRDMIKRSPDAALYVENFAAPTFETRSLPVGARSFADLLDDGCTEPDFKDALAYVAGRGPDIAAFGYWWTPSRSNGMNRRVIIPFLYEGRTVGFTARAIDPENRSRYYMNSPRNFLFNAQALTDHRRQLVVLVEGVFDAIALDSVATLGAHLNQDQVAWIRSYKKRVIVLPDRDQQGSTLIDVALKNDWEVSFCASPRASWWEADVKDSADAVYRYGRLWTITGVLEEATSHKIKINFLRKSLIK